MYSVTRCSVSSTNARNRESGKIKGFDRVLHTMTRRPSAKLSRAIRESYPRLSLGVISAIGGVVNISQTPYG